MKKIIYSLLLVQLCILSAYGKIITHSDAEYVKFKMKSKKAGLITTSFDGFAHKFSLDFVKKDLSIESAELQFSSADLDTSNSSRNEKMWNLCLQKDQFPLIKVILKKMVNLSQPKGLAEIEIEILGQKYDYPIEYEFDDKNQTLNIQATLSLKNLKIPDPSIWIATVLDDIKVEVSFKLIP